jgi:hypothetical protein
MEYFPIRVLTTKVVSHGAGFHDAGWFADLMWHKNLSLPIQELFD